MVSITNSLTYTGEVQPKPDEYAEDGLYPYLPSPELVEAVNLTIFLEKRPLLIKGDPGSGVRPVSCWYECRPQAATVAGL